MAQAMELAIRAPALCNREGVPLSWQHFVYGMAALRRLDARESLRLAGAVGAPNQKKEDYEKWRQQQLQAGDYLWGG
jgi:hypothetical protein